jgi:hypothetical protein
MTRDEIISSMGWPALANHIPDDDDLICRIERIVEQATAALRTEISENESVINVWRGRAQRAEAELRSKLASAACFAIVTERQGKYPGAYQVADAVLDGQCDPPTDEITHLRVSLEHVASGLAAAEEDAAEARAELARLTTLAHKHEWFRTGEMEPGEIRCINCGAWGKEETPLPDVKEAK